MFWNLRFPLADARFDTTLPRTFFISASFLRPPTVRSLVPRKTSALAMRPLAIFETRFAFIVFMPFMDFIGRAAWVGRAMASRCPPVGLGRAAGAEARGFPGRRGERPMRCEAGRE